MVEVHVYGGQCREKAMGGVWKVDSIPYTKLNGIVLYLYFFGGKNFAYKILIRL